MTFIIAEAMTSFLDCFKQYQQQCFIFVVIVQIFGPMPMFVYFTRSLNLIYENCRIRFAISLAGNESIVIRLKPMEKFANFYFSTFKKYLAPPKQIPSMLSVEVKHANKNGQDSKDASVSSNEDLDFEQKFDGEISDKILVASLVPFFIVSILLLVFPMLIYTSDLLLFGGCPHYQIYTPVLLYLGLSFFLIPMMLWSIYWIKDGLGNLDMSILILRNEKRDNVIVLTLFIAIRTIHSWIYSASCISSSRWKHNLHPRHCIQLSLYKHHLPALQSLPAQLPQIKTKEIRGRLPTRHARHLPVQGIERHDGP